MTFSDQLRPVARVLKSNGADGQLVLGLQGLDTDVFISLVTRKNVPVFIFFDGRPVPFFLTDVCRRGDTKVLSYLTGIRTQADIAEVEGEKLWMERQALSEDEDPMEDLSLLVGWTLLDKGLKAGEIVAFEDFPGNPCVELENGALVPLREDLILSLDEEKRILDMDLPEGLLNV
ncbi:MAG: hypothetical protein J6Y32_07945 [Bacteroidales bacterium]|nr:hypothetical protein [Bacteroidales bacterium]